METTKITATLIVGFAFVIVAAAISFLPLAWIVMLAAGNFGFTSLGLVDCLPAGVILGMLVASN